ncbi:MAG: ABC transporter ATP-binding protein [Ruminococcus sp.]|nr:ABC transporter ATP-binding protein [Candidatus Apopatosoma intestinale]
MEDNLEKRKKRLINGLKKIDPDVDEDDVLLLFSTDLSMDSRIETGYVVMGQSMLSVYTGGQKKEFLLSEISEIRYTAGFGCVTIECVQNGSDVILCRSTMAKLHEVSVICKQMNRHIGGRPIELREDKDLENVCPKCGRPYTDRNRICKHCTNYRGNIKWLWSIAKPEWLKIGLATLMILGSALISMLTPKINAIMVDGYIKSSDPVSLTWQSFALVVLALAGAEIASRLINMIRNAATAYAGNNISKRLRKSVFEKIESLSFGKVSKQQTGELMERVSGDTEVIRQQITGMIPELVYQFFIIIAVSVIIFRFDWRLGILIFIPIPFVFFGFYSFWGVTRRNYHKQWTKNSRVSTILHDIFNGIRVVKSFGMEHKEAERFDRSAKEVSDISIKNDVFFSIIAPLLNFAIGIGEFFLLYYAGNKILSGEMTLGVMTQFATYVSLIYGRMRWFANIPRRLISFVTSLSKICELLSEEPDIRDKEDSTVSEISGNISFDHVSFGYEDSSDVLRDISFDIRKGEMIGLVGKSGTGKSTLINLLMRLYDVDDGAIRIDGTDIKDIPQDVLRRNIGVVLQENYLFRGTIFQNIAYAKPDATRDEVIAAAKVSGAHSFVMKLPDGYDTYIGEHGQTLSGGEKQRISIARAMLHNPKILILDEATASLDTETEHDIQEALKKLTEDRTTIAIAHRLSTLRNATRLIVLDKGRIAEIGTHDELLRKKGIYYGLVMAQRQMSKMSEVKSKKCSG